MTSDELRKLADTSIKSGFSGHARAFRSAANEIDRLAERVAELERELERYKPYFECPECSGTYFGRDVAKDDAGKAKFLDTVRCHDEFCRGCTWHGVWPPKATEVTQ